jgi:tetratricopeptide (TPR) repeat protein
MYTLLFAVGLTLQSTAGSPAAPADQVAQAYFLFLQAQAAQERNDFGEAAEQYRQALLLVPAAAGIRAELAGVYAQQGDLTRARQEAEQVLLAAPANRVARRLLGLIAASSVEGLPAAEAAPVVARAIEHLERAQVPGLQDPALMLTLSEMYVRASRYPQAIDLLQEFLLDRPGYPQAVMLLVQAYRASGQPERAQELIASLGGGASTGSRLREVEAVEQRGQWRQAAEMWAAIVADNPSEVAYRLRHAAALVNAGRLEEGRDELVAVTTETPGDIRGWYLLSQVEQRAGRTAEAEAAARRIGQIDPEDARGPLALALVYEQRRDFKAVINVLRPRVAMPASDDLDAGHFSEMATLLAGAYRSSGDARQGIRTLEEARTHASDDTQILFALAAAYEQDDQHGRAEQTFRTVLETEPDHAAALNYLGYMLADRGQKLPEALTLIERAIAVGGENPSYLDSLGWAYFRLSRFDEAVGPLERAAAGAPRVSVIQDHLGEAYMKLERYDQAVEAFDRALAGDRRDIDAREVTRKRDRARDAAQRAGR